MKNGNLTEFMDKLYYGEELEFEYLGKYYFLQGWSEGNISKMTLDAIDHSPFKKYTWECNCDSMRECAEAFIQAPIWEGKSFLQIENDVTWID